MKALLCKYLLHVALPAYQSRKPWKFAHPWAQNALDDSAE